MILVSAIISAEDTFTSSLKPTDNFASPKIGHLTFSIVGSTGWVATVSVQRSFDNGASWVTVETYTEDFEKAIEDKTDDILYRIGVATGGYTSGVITVRLAK